MLPLIGQTLKSARTTTQTGILGRSVKSSHSFGQMFVGTVARQAPKGGERFLSLEEEGRVEGRACPGPNNRA